MEQELISRGKRKFCHSEPDSESNRFRIKVRNDDIKTVAIIGAGPAGCICAKFLKDAGMKVTLFDRGKFLRTLLPTGGGRCNLAHAEYDFKELARNYPRGEKFLYSVFSRFGTSDTIDFFENIGVKTYTQDDGRIFPVSNSASEVREYLMSSIRECKLIKEKVISIIPPTAQAPLPPKRGQTFTLKDFSRALRNNMTKQEIILWQYLRKKQLGVKFRRQHPINDKYIADFACVEKKLIIEVDGSQHIESNKDIKRTLYLENEGYKIIRFYNNDIDNNIEGCLEYLKKELEKFAPFQGEMPEAKGVKPWRINTNNTSYAFDFVVAAIGGHAGYEILNNLDIKITSTTQSLVGLTTQEDFSTIAGVAINDILFTHKGVSGPFIYKISSINARKPMPYTLSLELVPEFNLQEYLDKNPHKEIKNLLGQFIPKSLAEWILNYLNISLDTPCHKINGKTRDKILNKLTNFEITITGKVPDGEVVTCGGVDLKEVNSKTLESKQYPGLYFCGEVLDIDGFCGGFNLQNCWSTGYIAAQAIINS